ncbi:DVU_1553 family AMP-dependent CoA ligase [Anaeromicrobium sediminis]|nr:AMP-binding protein [Anaeromicrobium sediminis]
MSVHLQEGLFELCANRIKKDDEFQAIVSNKNFDEITYDLFQEYKLFQLQRTVKHVYENSKFYRNKLNELSIKPEDIKSLEDISKLQFTFPNDLRSEGQNFQFLCTSQRDVEKPVTFHSSGTTGIKKRIYFSKKDVQKILDFLPRGMETVEDRDKCCAQIFLPNGEGRGIAAMLASGLMSFGMRACISDMSTSAEDAIKVCKENKSNVWFGDAFTIYRVTKQMAKKIDLSSLGVKVLFLTMGNISSPMKEYLEKTWNCRVSTHYGLTEMGWGLAVDCDICDGYHYNELDVIAEVVDPETGELLPEGEIGELVLTSIARDAMPLIRFRTGDISALEKPECGYDLEVMKHIVSRLEGSYQLPGGTKINPPILEEAIFNVEEIVDYQAFMKEDRLYLKVETVDLDEWGVDEVKVKEQLIEEILQLEAFKNSHEPSIELLEPNSLKPFVYEKKRILHFEKIER